MTYVAVGDFLGVEFKVTEDTASDFMFLLETSELRATADGASIAVKLGEQLELAVEFFEDLIADLKNGVAQGWFEPTSVDNIIKVATDNIEQAKAKM